MSNLSSEMITLLTEQVQHETYNSQLYSKIGVILKNIGLNNIGKYFVETQSLEEIEHRDLILTYLTDRNINIDFLEIPKVDFDYVSMTDLAEKYLKREQDTTGYLKKVAELSLQESDFITFGFVQDMINRQRIEEADALTFLDKAISLDNDMKFIMLWDADFSL